MLGQCVRVYIVSAIAHPACAACQPGLCSCQEPGVGAGGVALSTWALEGGRRCHSQSESRWATKGENPIGFQYNPQCNCAGNANWGPKFSNRYTCLRR